jgi:hypothetical protein
LSRRRSDMMEPLVRHNSPLHHHFGESTRADGRLPRHGMIHVRFPSSSSTWSARPRFSCAGAYGHPSADLCGASVLAVLSQGAPIIAARSLVAASPRDQSSSAALLPDGQVGIQTRESSLQGWCLCQRGAGTSPCPVHCSHYHSFTHCF